MITYYIIQGEIKEICPVERYGYTFKNIIVGDKYIHMAKGATWPREDTQVGDEVAVTCFDNSVTEANGDPCITGVTVTWLGGKRATSRVLTPQEFAEKMKNISMNDDTEMGHVNMDNLMCEVLESLGYKEGIDVFRNTGKWYA